MNYISPIANEVAWHHAVEKLLGIEITPRCKYLRTILAELARISDHLLCVGAAALDLGGADGVPVRLQPAGEDLQHLRAASGQRFHPSYLPGRRADERHHRRRGRPDPRVRPTTFPKAHADIARLLNRNKHLHRPDQGRRRAVEGGGDQHAAATGPGGAGVGRRPGPAEGRAVPGVHGTAGTFKVVCATRRRLLRAGTWSAWRRWSSRSRSSRRRSRTSRPGR